MILSSEKSQTLEQKLKIQLRKICRYAKEYNDMTKPIRSSSLEGVELISLLQRTSHSLNKAICDYPNSKIETIVSKGHSNIPKILWLAIVERGAIVSMNISTVICFGKKGEGIVYGNMEPTRFGVGLYDTVIRTDKPLKIDVNGSKADNKYNDKFINPKEMAYDEFDIPQLILDIKDLVNKLPYTKLNQEI
jgi:hypothetical protein